MKKSDIVYFIERFIPDFLVRWHRNNKPTSRKGLWIRQQRCYQKEVTRLQGTDQPLNVVFLVLYASVWKYDSVYKLMEQDPRFKPLILVCPIADYGHDHMVENLKPTYEMFKAKGYNVICAYDEKTQQYVRVEDLKPDILMYAFQWSCHVNPQYNVYSLQKYLKCYVNYSFKNTPYEYSIASQEQSLMWQYYSECNDNRELINTFKHFKGEFSNVHIVGYPMYDEIKEHNAIGKDWKIKSTTYKRIIWAPHHSIEGDDHAIKLSTFLLNAEFMIEMARKYNGKVQFAFKPHPQLRPALEKHPQWGKEKTDAYYDFWENSENTVFVNGEYVDLFKSSDAMIHDSGSFVVEYLYVQKPVMFCANYDRESQSNAVGKKAFACHYHGFTHEDIDHFIQDVVIDGKDNMQEQRQSFYNDILVPPHGKTVAENIINEITQALKI